MDHKEVG